ncbi:MAG TPA: hypothetical protein VI837_09620 [Blastocatellia bacterium]|nr:hypothetical protein [Blastocatellia bacterium]
MEREKEIAKLVNVLRRTSRMALQSEWTGGSQDVASFCIDQYNRVLARLKEIDPGVSAVFDPLAPGSSLTVAAMACRQLAAYYEDEVGRTAGSGDWKGVWGDPRYGMWVDKRAFKEFWNKSAREVEDLGEFIRESIDDWVNQRKTRGKREEGGERTTTRIDPEDTKPQ